MCAASCQPIRDQLRAAVHHGLRSAVGAGVVAQPQLAVGVRAPSVHPVDGARDGQRVVSLRVEDCHVGRVAVDVREARLER